MEPDAAKIIEEIMADIERKASSWQYEADIERHREWGEKLSRQFYAGTPWSKTRERLTTEANVIFRYAGVMDAAVQGQNTYGYKIAPMAFYPKYRHASADEPEDNIILVRFSFEHNFSTYLTYPFFFLHEYASHIHGANSDSDIFDDGWMMYFIHKPTTQVRRSLPSRYWLNTEQNKAIDEYCPHKLSSGLLQRYYYLAQHIDNLTLRFKQLTLDLAGYSLTQENPYFLADFMERLTYHFKQNRQDLKRKIESYTNVDELFMRLPSP